jgi:drug/metabolite transporter (DMT)-like permease
MTTVSSREAPRQETLLTEMPAVARQPSPWGVYGLLAVGVVCIAFSAIFVRWAEVPGLVSAWWRVLIATVALGPLFWRRVGRGAVPRDARLWLLAAGAGLFFALDIALWNTALFQTHAADATLLANDAPIVVGLGALVFFRERLSRRYWLGLGIALAGMCLIVLRPEHASTTAPNAELGDALALGAGVFYAGYLLMTQRVRARMDTLSSLWLAGASGVLFLLVVNLVAHQTLWGFAPRQYAALLGLGLISQVIGWLAINAALGRLPATLVSVTLLAQPVLTAVLAVPLLQDTLGPPQVVGGAIALAGIALVNLAGSRRRAAEPVAVGERKMGERKMGERKMGERKMGERKMGERT